MNDREKEIVKRAMDFHQKWMDLINFRHPGMFSSRAKEAIAAQKANRKIRDAYDDSFASLLSCCELNRQER